MKYNIGREFREGEEGEFLGFHAIGPILEGVLC